MVQDLPPKIEGVKRIKYDGKIWYGADEGIKKLESADEDYTVID